VQRTARLPCVSWTYGRSDLNREVPWTQPYVWCGLRGEPPLRRFRSPTPPIAFFTDNGGEVVLGDPTGEGGGGQARSQGTTGDRTADRLLSNECVEGNVDRWFILGKRVGTEALREASRGRGVIVDDPLLVGKRLFHRFGIPRNYF
jgi:hypothetical protein